MSAEHGAARFNLGLVQRDCGDPSAAVASFERARALLEQARLPAQAAAASREAGTTRLAAGDLDLARRALERSRALADRAGHEAGLGATLNALGLVHLHDGRPDEAIEALRSAAAGHPRALRPEGYAMAKANLALAYEQVGEQARARLAARQALGVRGRPEAAAAQAAAVLQRLKADPGDLMRTLDEEPAERWPALVREELARWVDAEPAERLAEVESWIDGQLVRAGRGVDRAEAWVGGLLELAPESLEAMIRSTLEALEGRDERSREIFTAELDQALARFHVPQLMRLKSEFQRIAADTGSRASWS